MLYETLRAAARVALRWYYGEIIVQGRERLPAQGPLLIVANHPNALVDAMLVATVCHRRVLITARSTLFEHPLLGAFLGQLGVVPLLRAQDIRAAARHGEPISRNDASLDRVTSALSRTGVVLVFPEGISHDAPGLAPLKTGAARMALQAHAAHVSSLRILPIGLVFEEKERPRSRVLVRIGDPIDVDAWCLADALGNAAALTKEIDIRLRRVTLNFATAGRAHRAVRIARSLAAISEEPAGLGSTRTFEAEAAIAARVESATEALDRAAPALGAAADAFSSRLEGLEARLHARGGALTDARVSLRLDHGAQFALREGVLIATVLPLAALGRVTHWPPLFLARVLAMRSLRGDPSRDQPAMRTMVLGLAAVLLWYALLAVAVAWWLGGVAASLLLATLFAAANVNVWLHGRVTRVRQRARTYLALRGDAEFRVTVLREIEDLLAEADLLERALLRGDAGAGPG